MCKSVRVFFVLLIVWAMLMASGCQPANEPAEIPIAETEAPQEEPVSNPAPEPTETPTPEPTPVPTADPLDIRFGSSGNELFNIDGGGPVQSVAWAPDSSMLAMGGNANIVIWETRSLTRKSVMVGHSAPIIDMDWSPDGGMLASLDIDGILRLWDMTTFTENAVFETGNGFRLDWSPDGNRLAIGTLAGIIQILDSASEQQLMSWEIPTDLSVSSIDWSPDGNLIASGDASGVLYIWDANSGAATTTLDAYADELSFISDLAWSPSGAMLATAHLDGNLRLWDPQSWEVSQSIAAHPDGVYKIAWSPGSYLIASGGSDSSVPIWNPQSGERVTGVGTGTPVWTIAWSPNGKMLAVGTAGMLTKPSHISGGGNAATGFTEDEILAQYYEPNPEAGLINLWVRLK